VSEAVVLRRDGPEAGPATPGFEALLTGLGHAVVRSLRVERAEHGRTHVGPAAVDRLRAALTETGAEYVAVDNVVHPGQQADLLAALSAPSASGSRTGAGERRTTPVTLRDRRGVVYDALAAGGNRVAENRGRELTAQVERRQVLARERDQPDGGGPDAQSGRVAELDRRRQRLDDDLDGLQRAAREAVAGGAGTRVVVADPLGLSSGLWAALVGDAEEPPDDTDTGGADGETATGEGTDETGVGVDAGGETGTDESADGSVERAGTDGETGTVTDDGETAGSTGAGATASGVELLPVGVASAGGGPGSAPGPGDADARAGQPAEPVTRQASVGGVPVAVTGVALLSGLPAWYETVAPGAVAALDRADVVVLAAGRVRRPAAGGGEETVSVERTVAAVRECVAAPVVVAGAGGVPGEWPDVSRVASVAAVRERVRALLPVTRLAVQLPYADDAHALVSWAHEVGAVERTEYEDAVRFVVRVRPTVAEELTRRVDRVGGEVVEDV
jgi:hypothetical protein